MDSITYDKLRKKISNKDFEGNYKGLDKWLYRFSFIGNVGSIFFSYFLVYPGLHKAISINIVNGILAIVLAFIATNTFLIVFEIIKRYLIRNFSADFVANSRKIDMAGGGWLIISISIIALSFYLSIFGSKNLASTSSYTNKIVENKSDAVADSISTMYEKRKNTYVVDNDELRKINNDIRNTLIQTPTNYVSIRNGYQSSIDKNVKIINENQSEIDKIDAQLNIHILDLNQKMVQTKSENKIDDTQNIVLFLIIACFSEILIFCGVYFREYFEYKLYVLNQQKFEKIYAKKDRYRSLLTFIYGGGKLNIGDKVISGLELKQLVAEKTNIQNSNKMIDEFLHDMDRLGVFNTVGKRRFISVAYHEAMNVVDSFDDALRIIENMK